MILLDTHIWVRWLVPVNPLPAALVRRIEDADRVAVSAISCWEVGMLVVYGRITLPLPLPEFGMPPNDAPILPLGSPQNRVGTKGVPTLRHSRWTWTSEKGSDPFSPPFLPEKGSDPFSPFSPFSPPPFLPFLPHIAVTLLQKGKRWRFPLGEYMQAFSVDDVQMHPEALAASAQAGQLALVTNQGQPLFVSVPFDETMLREGVHVALAVNLFKSGEFSSGKAAELARMSKIAFIEFVSRLGIPVVDYPADEIKAEMAGFD